jgi:protein-S-isoprenylcysteine O-methyltransferase Ste14
MTTNPKRAPPSDPDIDQKLIEIVPPTTKGVNVLEEKRRVQPFVLTKREPVLLDHKRRVKNTPLDWIIWVVYVLSLYGFLVLSIYLLNKAAKDNSRAAGICYFSIFVFFIIALVVFVTLYQRRMQKHLVKRPDQEGEPLETPNS